MSSASLKCEEIKNWSSWGRPTRIRTRDVHFFVSHVDKIAFSRILKIRINFWTFCNRQRMQFSPKMRKMKVSYSSRYWGIFGAHAVSRTVFRSSLHDTFLRLPWLGPNERSFGLFSLSTAAPKTICLLCPIVMLFKATSCYCQGCGTSKNFLI